MSTVRMRTAREADVPAIRRIVADAFAPFTTRTGIVPAPVGTDWATVISALGAVVALVDDRIAGVLVLWPHPDHVLVETLAVSPSDQHSGVGASLLDRAELLAIETGVNAVRLSANAAMTEPLAYYPRRGFVETRRAAAHGLDRVFFEKRLV